MRELTCIVDPTTGDLTMEGLTRKEALALVGDLLPAPAAVNCARPLGATIPGPPQLGDGGAQGLRVFRIYHGSVVEGPGRCSVLQVSGCSVRCAHCFARETWDPMGGVEMSVGSVVQALLDPSGEPRDGISLLGGERLDQPIAIAGVMRELKARGQRLVLYSGYALQALTHRPELSVREALCLSDILIDGPFVQRFSDVRGSGEDRETSESSQCPAYGCSPRRTALLAAGGSV